MSSDRTRIFPLGENALTIEFANEISPSLNDRVLALYHYFRAEPFPGFIEAVPAYSSLTLFFDVSRVPGRFAGFESPIHAVKSFVNAALEQLPAAPVTAVASHPIEVPVFFDDASAPDLNEVARVRGMSRDDVISVFTSRVYRVFMIGFLPGFAYMGEVDERIAMPRKATPRLKVPKGSVGIAGRQTGIYPFESPGGWQIIGRTRIELFTPDDDTPCYLHTGDHVKFYEVREV